MVRFPQKSLMAAAVFFVLAISPPKAYPRLSITNDTEFGSGSVSGPGASRSIITGRGTFSSIFGVNMVSEADTSSYYFSMTGRATSDHSADYRNFSLSQLHGRFKTRGQTVSLGDIMESFSQYSLGSSLKGVSYTACLEKAFSPRITVLYGHHSPRWDSLLNANDEINAIQRQAYGLKLAGKPLSDWNAAVHFIGSSDKGRITAWDPLSEGSVYGLTWAYDPFEGLALSGESSFSDMMVSPGAGIANDKRNGSANRVSFRGVGDGLRLDVDYERVSPGFLTVLGAATPDRERARVGWMQNYNANMTVHYSALWFHDNLDGRKLNTTHNYRPDVRLTQRRLFGRRYAAGDIACRLESRVGDIRETNSYIDLGYRDRFGRIDSDTRAGFASYSTSGGIRDGCDYIANTALSMRGTVKKLVFRPNLRLGTRVSEDGLTDKIALINEASVGTSIDYPVLGISSSIQTGINRLMRDAGDDSSRTFVNANMYYRPSLTGGNYTVFFRYSCNDFSNTGGDGNYLENSLAFGLNLQY